MLGYRQLAGAAFTDLGKIEEMLSWRTLGDLTSLKGLGRLLSDFDPPVARDAEPFWVSSRWCVGRTPAAGRATADGPGMRSAESAVGDILPVIGRQHAYRQQAQRRGRSGRSSPRRPRRSPRARVRRRGTGPDGPSRGSDSGSVGRPTFGVYVPTLFGGELTIKTTDGTVGMIIGPDGRERQNGQEVGTQSARLVYLRGDRGDQALQRRDHLRPGRAERPEALELLLLADQGRRHPRALGRRQRPRRHDASPVGDDQLVATPGGYIAPARTSSVPAPMACSKRPSPPGDDSPGSLTSMTT